MMFLQILMIKKNILFERKVQNPFTRQFQELARGSLSPIQPWQYPSRRRRPFYMNVCAFYISSCVLSCVSCKLFCTSCALFWQALCNYGDGDHVRDHDRGHVRGRTRERGHRGDRVRDHVRSYLHDHGRGHDCGHKHGRVRGHDHGRNDGRGRGHRRDRGHDRGRNGRGGGSRGQLCSGHRCFGGRDCWYGTRFDRRYECGPKCPLHRSMSRDRELLNKTIRSGDFK